MTIDILCTWLPTLQKFTFAPLTGLARDWFEENLGATGENYMADKETSMQITRQMLLCGLIINSEGETQEFKKRFDIKGKPTPIVLPDVKPIPVPNKLDEWDTRRLHALGVCWDGDTR